MPVTFVIDYAAIENYEQCEAIDRISRLVDAVYDPGGPLLLCRIKDVAESDSDIVAQLLTEAGLKFVRK